MDFLAGPFAAACVLLSLAGGFKLVRPLPTLGALKGVGLPGSLAAVRLLGAAEVVVGVAALLTGVAPVMASVSVAYAAFGGFVVAARRRGAALQSCGCFGDVDVPPTNLHVAVNVIASVTAAVAAITRLDVLDVVSDQPASGVPFVGLCALTVALLYLLLTALPRLQQEVAVGGRW
jgi:hypothetical protein